MDEETETNEAGSAHMIRIARKSVYHGCKASHTCIHTAVEDCFAARSGC